MNGEQVLPFEDVGLDCNGDATIFEEDVPIEMNYTIRHFNQDSDELPVLKRLWNFVGDLFGIENKS